MSVVRVAYIGCGAVVERSHLPALLGVENATPTVLIDLNRSQLELLKQTYGVDNIGTSIDEFLDEFDLAVIATPSASHYALGKQLLSQGKHVLMEKPLASNYEQAKELVELSDRSQKVLAVSLVRRFLPHFQLFKSLLESSVIGQVVKFEVEEGGVFNWPVQSASFYNHSKSGGGVLIDNGAHLLDALLWWLGDFKNAQYLDDAQGGVEADCHLDLTLSSGAQGTVTMSRLRNLRNEISVYGELGSLSMSLASGDIRLKPHNSRVVLGGQALAEGVATTPSVLSLFEQQYRGVVDAISNNLNEESSIVLANECLPSIRLIDACYRERSNLDSLRW